MPKSDKEDSTGARIIGRTERIKEEQGTKRKVGPIDRYFGVGYKSFSGINPVSVVQRDTIEKELHQEPGTSLHDSRNSET